MDYHGGRHVMGSRVIGSSERRSSLAFWALPWGNSRQTSWRWSRLAPRRRYTLDARNRSKGDVLRCRPPSSAQYKLIREW
jgi:hypothetical protein